MVAEEATFTIGELAQKINRSETTIRVWCREDRLPEPLRPRRVGKNGWRRWTQHQIDLIKIWMQQQRMFPGGGLACYHPSPAEVDEVLERLRAGKRPRIEDLEEAA